MLLAESMGGRLSPPGRGAGARFPGTPGREPGGVVVVPLPPLPDAQAAGQFFAQHEARACEGVTVLDLDGFVWLSSLELGAVVRLARAARRGGRPLFLASVSARVHRLLRLFRLDRFLDMPTSPEAWARRLGELAGPPHGRGPPMVRSPGACPRTPPDGG